MTTAFSLAWNGLLQFGTPDTITSYVTGNLSGDPSPDGSGTSRLQRGILPDGIRGRWMVVELPATTPDPALVVSSPIYPLCSGTDMSSMALTAKNGETAAVQSRPRRIDTINPTYRDPVTGLWEYPINCDVIALRESGAVGTAAAEVVFLDAGYVPVGFPGSPWGGSETPPSAWTPRTSWQDITIPSNAIYVAVKLSWTGTTGAPASGNTVYFRAPKVNFKDGLTNNYARTRYV